MEKVSMIGVLQYDSRVCRSPLWRGPFGWNSRRRVPCRFSRKIVCGQRTKNGKLLLQDRHMPLRFFLGNRLDLTQHLR